AGHADIDDSAVGSIVSTDLVLAHANGRIVQSVDLSHGLARTQLDTTELADRTSGLEALVQDVVGTCHVTSAPRWRRTTAGTRRRAPGSRCRPARLHRRS